MFALSLSWNTNKYRDVEKQVNEVIEAGFKAVELNFSLTKKQLRKINKIIKKGIIKVVSCHNFCPIPPGIPIKKAMPDCYSLSSLNERRRRLAIKYTKTTVDSAYSLGAKVIVLHSGRVEIPDTSRQLMSFFAQGKKESSEFRKFADCLYLEREAKKKPYLEKVTQSINEVCAYARGKGIKVALENRIYYPEIPQLDEFELLLKDTPAYFWFDTGHAFIMEKLWNVSVADYLKRYGTRLIGLHLHDVKLMQDHLAPGKGEFDFKLLKPFIKPDTIKVIEAHASATAADLKKSISILNKALN
ncbi:MAG: sugar phosphate isomerase/epimerase [Candidatus Omnitrophota bacterium]